MRPQGNFSNQLAPEFLKYTSILILGTGIGLLSTVVSPIATLIGAAGFAGFAVILYANAFSRSQSIVDTISIHSDAQASQHRLLFLFFFLSFFVSVTIPKSGRTISGVPFTSANILILFSLILWSLSLLFSKHLATQTPLFRVLLVFMLSGVINSGISLMYHNPPKVILIEFAAFFGFVPVYFLTCTVMKNHFRLRALLFVLIISLVLVCLYGALQLRRGFENVAVPGITEQYNMIRYAEFGGRWNYIEGNRQKLYSTFQNGNIFGGHLAMFLPFLGGIILAMQSRWKKIILLLVFIGIWYALFLTYSRGALLGGVIGILILAIFGKKIKIQTLAIALIFGISLFVFINQNADRPEFARYNFRRLATDPDQFSAGRLQRVESAIKMFNKLPFFRKLFGIGMGADLVVDNLYVYLFVKLGIVGFLILLWTLGKLFMTLMKWRAGISDIRLQGLMNGGIAGLIASLVHNIADVLWLFPPLAPNFWFLAGLTMSIGMIGSQESSIKKQLRSET